MSSGVIERYVVCTLLSLCGRLFLQAVAKSLQQRNHRIGGGGGVVALFCRNADGLN